MREEAANRAILDGRLTALRKRRQAVEAALTSGEELGTTVPVQVDLETQVEQAVALSLRLRELLGREGDESVLALREQVLAKVIRRIDAFPEKGYLEVTPIDAPGGDDASPDTAEVSGGGSVVKGKWSGRNDRHGSTVASTRVAV